MYDRADARLPRPKFMLLAFSLLAILALSAGALVYTNAADAKRSKARVDRTERQVVRIINQVRRANGLERVTSSRRLARSADYHSRDMIRRDFFAHSSSNGTSMAKRVRRYSRAGRVGENIAYTSGHAKRGVARRIVGMWLASPSHRAVLLSPGFRKIGVARRKGKIGSQKVQVFTADLSSRGKRRR